MPTIKSAATTAAVVLFTLFVASRFAPATIKKQLGLS